MDNIDDFASLLLEESKRFLEKAQSSTNLDAYLHAALNLAFCSLEAHVNAIAEEMLLAPNIAAWDISVLAEKKIELKNGRITVLDQQKMYRLEDRLLFISQRFTAAPIDRNSPEWSRLREAVKLRNALTHPKEAVVLTQENVAGGIKSILDILDLLYRGLYKKPHPRKSLGLQSSLNF